ncbi:MAG: tryptophan--tRNA ligase [Planctomycetes bacterium]|nr:tryptophan--tRNA ligase [Planctomycetota bacterium]
MVRTMSGVQPTGNLHIGNYLGALVNWVELQQQFEAYFCVVDLHALTQRPDPAALQRAVREVTIGILASGVDPERATLFVQSHVPQHTELAWVLTCLTPLGDLQRMTQFKDKSAHQPENINAGLFTYPVLQAADIVLYRAERVPVGEDQEQHLELARETVRRFNFVYGDTFPEPQVVRSQAPRVMGLDGESKMSKSRNNEIGLFETADETLQKLRGAKTDPQRLRRSDPGNPQVCNIFALHGFFTSAAQRAEIDAGCRAATLGCVDCKKQLAANLEAVKGPIRERARELREHPARVDEILAAGAAKARAAAEATMALVRERIGLRAPRQGGGA